VLNGTTGASRAASVAALTTAAGAVACGVCCVVSFALPAVAAAGAGGTLAWVGRAHGTMTLIASAIVVAAWISVGFQSRRARKRPASTTLYAIVIATAILALAIVWPRIEPYLIDLLRARP
jgi:cytochrome bd-type quinol oxidase subunit 2